MFKQKKKCPVTVIGCLKGGAGKSTVTILVAATLASDYAMQSIGFEKGFKVLVVDADLQTSIYKERDAEISSEDFLDKDIFDTVCVNVADIHDFFKKENLELVAKDAKGGKYYDLPWQSEDDAKNKSKPIKHQLLQHYESGHIFDNYDFIFIDLVGSIDKGSQVKRAYVYSDNLFIPLRPTNLDVRSFMEFIPFVKKIVETRLKVEFETNVVTFGNAVRTTTLQKSTMDIIKTLVETNGFVHSKTSLGVRNIYESVSTMNTPFDYFVLERYENFMKNRTDPRSSFSDKGSYEFTSFFLFLCSYLFDVVPGADIVPFIPEAVEAEEIKENE